MIEVMDVQKSVMKRLYYFTPHKYASDIIKNGRLKVSRFLEANDPFELRSYDQSDRDFRNFTTEMLNQENKKFGMLCFCRNWTNPVMWAHYAEQHEGVCYGFDIDEAVTVPVSYQSERSPEGDFHRNMRESEISPEPEKIFDPWKIIATIQLLLQNPKFLVGYDAEVV
jgi:hypothetical protein